MQSSSNAEKAKVYLLFLLLFCFDDNSICFVKIALRKFFNYLQLSSTICNYVQDQEAEPQPSNLCTSAKLGYGWGRKWQRQKIVDVKQESCEYQILSFGLTQPGNLGLPTTRQTL